MCDSTSTGCRKSADLTKDRFTKVQSLVDQWNIGYSLRIRSQITGNDGCCVRTSRIIPMWAWSWHHAYSILWLGMSRNMFGILWNKITWYIKPNKCIQLDFNTTVIMQLNFEYLPANKPIHISSWNICICSLVPLLNFKVYFIHKNNTVFAVQFCCGLLCNTGSVLDSIQFYKPSYFTVSRVTAINVMVQLFSHLSSTIIKETLQCVVLLQCNDDEDPTWYARVSVMNVQVWEEKDMFTSWNELESKCTGEMYSLLPSVSIH